MAEYYLAIDIGASSGRHILGHCESGKIVLEEIYRFSNGMTEKNGHKVWDTDRLFGEILTGMRKCREMGKIPQSVSVDTWGVDFVLLDREGRRLGDAVAYRDDRTNGMDQKVYELLPEEKLYRRTGIQKQIFNTIYQLMALKTLEPELLEQADAMLMMPDYLHYLLCGQKVQEYTNATTSQLVDPQKKDWDMALIEQLGYPKHIFQKMTLPGSILGPLSEQVAKEIGFQCRVVLAATHDTASAVIAVPAQKEDVLYISSGTWSLMGTERMEADCSDESRLYNFTNEGGFHYRYRYLKNIMGLWMIQSAKKELAPDTGFGEICEAASRCGIPSIVSCNDARFLAPESMTKEVQDACQESGQPVPKGIAEVAAVIYNSLAKCYADTVSEIEQRTGRVYDNIHIVGGGANADYLNRLTAKACKRRVEAGPTEATAIGNLAVQMMTAGVFQDLSDARNYIHQSFEIVSYEADGSL